MALDRAENGSAGLGIVSSEGPGHRSAAGTMFLGSAPTEGSGNRSFIGAIFFGGVGFPEPPVSGDSGFGGLVGAFGGGFFERFGERLW